MTPADELMALAGKWATKARHSRTTTHSTALRAQHATLMACAADLRALLDSDAFRAMARDAFISAVVWRFIDRMNDVAPEAGDPAERIVAEFVAAVMPAIDAAASGAGGS